MLEKSGVGRADLLVILTGLGQAKRAIRSIADNVGVRVILSIVVPPANWAKAHAVRGAESLISTAHTSNQDHS